MIVYSIDPSLSSEEIAQDLKKSFEMMATRTKAKMIKVIQANPGINRYDLWLNHFSSYSGQTIRNYLTDLLREELIRSELDGSNMAHYYITLTSNGKTGNGLRTTPRSPTVRE